MTALAQALTSIRHRPGRAFLTALGTALGIGTIVALLAVSAGATQTAGQFIHLGRSELGLFQKDAADPTTSVLPESLITRLRRQPWVSDTMGLQLLVNKVPADPAAIVFGAKPNSFELDRMVFTSGHALTAANPNQIVIGDELAPQLHAHVGDVLSVGHRHLRVVGIYHLGVTDHQQAGVTLLDQPLGGRGSGSRGELDDDRGHLAEMAADRLRGRQRDEGARVLLGDAEVVDADHPHVSMADVDHVTDVRV